MIPEQYNTSDTRAVQYQLKVFMINSEHNGTGSIEHGGTLFLSILAKEDYLSIMAQEVLLLSIMAQEVLLLSIMAQEVLLLSILMAQEVLLLSIMAQEVLLLSIWHRSIPSKAWDWSRINFEALFKKLCMLL